MPARLRTTPTPLLVNFIACLPSDIIDARSQKTLFSCYYYTAPQHLSFSLSMCVSLSLSSRLCLCLCICLCVSVSISLSPSPSLSPIALFLSSSHLQTTLKSWVDDVCFSLSRVHTNQQEGVSKGPPHIHLPDLYHSVFVHVSRATDGVKRVAPFPGVTRGLQQQRRAHQADERHSQSSIAAEPTCKRQTSNRGRAEDAKHHVAVTLGRLLNMQPGDGFDPLVRGMVAGYKSPTTTR